MPRPKNAASADRDSAAAPSGLEAVRRSGNRWKPTLKQITLEGARAPLPAVTEFRSASADRLISLEMLRDILPVWLQKLRAWFRDTTGIGRGEFLCDTCLYNYGSACERPERPNAIRCPDYKSKL